MPHQCTTCGHGFDDGSKEMLGGCPSCGGTTFQFYPTGTEIPDEPEGTTSAPDPGTSSVTDAVGRASSTVRNLVSRDDPDRTAAWPGEDGDDPDDPPVSSGDGQIIDADSHLRTGDGPEDGAQASARSDLVDEEELARHDEASVRSDEASVRSDEASVRSDEASVRSDEASARPEEADVQPEEVSNDKLDSTEKPGDDGPPDSAERGRVVSEPSEDDPELSELREQLNDQFESIKIVEPGQYELNLMELYDREEYVIALQENGRYVIQVPENWLGDRVED